MSTLRRGLVLPVVLVLIGLLALVMAGFVYHVRAEGAGARARLDSRQARLAANSGLQEVITVLRAAGEDAMAALDVPDTFRHALVWSPAYDRQQDPVRELGSRTELFARGERIAEAWRFSVCAENIDGVADTIRYGVTPEASKLNVNSASEDELRRLIEPVLQALGQENSTDLLAALFDWKDEDNDERPGGAESTYYNTLELGYYAKNGPLDTLEELLLVKGFSAAVLWGEDVNRNGVLDRNEDDGEGSFPYYDNGDGILDRGIAPYLTVWSTEPGEQGQVAVGRVNVNTAPLRVLQALDGMPPDAAERIATLRQELDAEARQKADWVVTAGALDSATYDEIKDKLTTHAFQYHVEIVGYADQIPVFQRHEWVLEMRGPLAQVLYHRDLTRLGLAWPMDDDKFVVEK